ncbi:protein starmaker-like isoform X2 [Saccostrea echinata]|uniref:protein starmaker-like isoform X2 n=1 Tax=Saccostrea echinata TaxID=191078 RepID=UPI002A826DF9|nr:protein starmaker-like isoform X2 [Saccostrea echinata]
MKRSGGETSSDDCKQAKVLKSNESVDTAENINDDERHYPEKVKMSDADDKHNSSPSKDRVSVMKKKISSSDNLEDSSSRRGKDGQNSSPENNESSGSKGEEKRYHSSTHKDKSRGSSRDRDKHHSSTHKDKSRGFSRDRDKHHSSTHKDKSRGSSRDRDKHHSSTHKDNSSGSRQDRDKQHSSSHPKDKSSGFGGDKDRHLSSSRKDKFTGSRKHKDISEYFSASSSPRRNQDEQKNSNPDYPSSSQKVKSPRRESRFNSVDLIEKTKLNLQDSITLMKQDYSKDRKEHFHFFFGKVSPFSNFHPAKFDLDGVTYSCSEQYMMHQKAVIFQDPYHANEIMKATDPVKMKKLGRQVQNFDAKHWANISEKVVKRGIMAKFKQNKNLMRALIATFPCILVEAAPRDRLWGIGLGAQNPKAHSRKSWRGKNKLGYLLTNIRNEIMRNEGLFS